MYLSCNGNDVSFVGLPNIYNRLRLWEYSWPEIFFEHEGWGWGAGLISPLILFGLVNSARGKRGKETKSAFVLSKKKVPQKILEGVDNSFYPFPKLISAVFQSLCAVI